VSRENQEKKLTVPGGDHIKAGIAFTKIPQRGTLEMESRKRTNRTDRGRDLS